MSEQHNRPLRRLLQYLGRYRLRVITAALFSILNKLFDLAPPLLIGAAVDIVVQRETSFLGKIIDVDVYQQLYLLAGLSLFVWCMESVFEYLYNLWWRGLAQDVQHDLRVRSYSHVQAQELSFFEERSSGQLMAVLNDDVNQLERFLDVGANDIIQVSTTVLAIGAFFVVSAPQIAWMALLPMPVIIFGSLYYQRLLEPLYQRVRAAVGEISRRLSNNLSGIATIKTFGTENFETAQLSGDSDRYRAANRSAIRVSSGFVPLIRMIIVLGFVGIMIFGGQAALDGTLNVGLYSVLIFMTQRLLWPLTRLGQTFDQYQRAMASSARVFGLLDTEEHLPDGPTSLERVQGEFLLEGVNFSYRTGLPVLQDLSLAIPAGKTTAVVGVTGSGKTTLIKLLLRLYDVQTGVVRLDGHDIRDIRFADLYRSVGFVSQDVFLFHGSVFANIAYGVLAEGVTDPGVLENPTPELRERVVRAARLAEADGFISRLPQGYDTIVGERGQKLSGGQRQRVSIARALLKDPEILILDEATSSVDNETEAAIQRSLEHIAPGRTTILIAHRLSTIRKADQILVLDNGRLTAQGTHDELVQAGGTYAELWRVQSGQ
ncbi:MAG: ABC transporter ATP-binding protein [Spirochaeta sp.]